MSDPGSSSSNFLRPCVCVATSVAVGVSALVYAIVSGLVSADAAAAGLVGPSCREMRDPAAA